MFFFAWGCLIQCFPSFFFLFKNSCECAETENIVVTEIRWHRNITTVFSYENGFHISFYQPEKNKIISHILHARNQPYYIGSLLPTGKNSTSMDWHSRSHVQYDTFLTFQSHFLSFATSYPPWMMRQTHSHVQSLLLKCSSNLVNLIKLYSSCKKISSIINSSLKPSLKCVMNIWIKKKSIK